MQHGGGENERDPSAARRGDGAASGRARGRSAPVPWGRSTRLRGQGRRSGLRPRSASPDRRAPVSRPKRRRGSRRLRPARRERSVPCSIGAPPSARAVTLRARRAQRPDTAPGRAAPRGTPGGRLPAARRRARPTCPRTAIVRSRAPPTGPRSGARFAPASPAGRREGLRTPRRRRRGRAIPNRGAAARQGGARRERWARATGAGRST
jgi:hypothetical protein